jgi:flagellar hook-length control protein FliK
MADNPPVQTISTVKQTNVAAKATEPGGVKNPINQAERLGGTETVSTKENRLNRDSSAPVSAPSPRSFWGVKVVAEPHPKQSEELPRNVTPEAKMPPSMEQPAPKMTTISSHQPPQPVRNVETPTTATEPKLTVSTEPKTVTARAVKPVEEHARQSADGQTKPQGNSTPDRPSAHAVESRIIEPAHEPVAKTAETPRSTGTESGAVTPSVAPTIQELAPKSPANVPTSSMLFTVEQIKELQTMVTHSLQGARLTVDGAQEAVFNWNHETLGPLSFRITARSDDVEIHIQSGRQDVADALKEGRGTVERMIADLGMKVERFEIKVRPESAMQDLANQAHEREQSGHGNRTDGDAPAGASMNLDLEPDEEPVQPSTTTPLRGWVA